MQFKTKTCSFGFKKTPKWLAKDALTNALLKSY